MICEENQVLNESEHNTKSYNNDANELVDSFSHDSSKVRNQSYDSNRVLKLKNSDSTLKLSNLAKKSKISSDETLEASEFNNSNTLINGSNFESQCCNQNNINEMISDSVNEEADSFYNFDENQEISEEELFSICRDLGIEIAESISTVANYDPKGPRLMLLNIVSDNFKSYFGTQTVGPFKKNFNSVIGPNGSGKSNVIDSILFVFGFRSSKMRSKKVSVMIHNREHHEDITSCTVTLNFQKIIDIEGAADSNSYEVIPDSQFSVSRTAFIDNSSYYCINRKKSSIKNVVDLLKGHGIDLEHKRFLIMQGEVEQISLMKPKKVNENDNGLLEFFEDIIGSNRYVEPIEKLASIIESISNSRNDLLNRLKVTEKNMKQFEAPRNEAISCLKLQNDCVLLKNKLYQSKRYLKKREKDKHLEEIKGVQEMLKQIQREILEIEESKKKYHEEHQQSLEVYSDLEKKLKECKDKLEEFSAKAISASENLKNIKSKLKESKSCLASEEKREKFQEELNDFLNLLPSMQTNKEETEVELNKVIATLAPETEKICQKKAIFDQNLSAQLKIVNDIKLKLDFASSKLEIKMSSFDKMLEKSADQKRRLEEVKDLVKTRKAMNRVIMALMQQKSSGKIKGIYGRLGDLGGIKPRYDVAISSCCSALESIVVDSVETAKECINFVSREKLGLITCICLDKMERWKRFCQTRITTPQNVPRLFDLITFADPLFAPAFYFALKDTLVADNMDQAMQVSYGSKRFRVVTINGDLIEVSGAITCGGSKKMKGRMGPTASKRFSTQNNDVNIDALNKELEGLEKSYEEVKLQKISLQSKISELSAKVNPLKVDKEKLEMDIQALIDEQVKLNARIKTSEIDCKNAKPVSKEVKELKSDVEAVQRDFDKENELAQNIEKDVNKYNAEIEKITNEKCGQLKISLKSLDENIKEYTRNINLKKDQLSKLERSKSKIEVKVASLQNLILKNEESCKALLSELEESEEITEKFKEKQEKHKIKLDDMSKEFQGLKEQIASWDAAAAELKSQEFTQTVKVETFQEVQRKLDNCIKEFTKELQKLKLKKWENLLSDDAERELLPTLNEDECENVDVTYLKCEIDEKEAKLKTLKANTDAIKNYEREEREFLSQGNELNEINKDRNQKMSAHSRLKNQRKSEFMRSFNQISIKLKEIYRAITLGGDAELELIDLFNPFLEGVAFKVRPPNKSWKDVINLSGGEKTLSSVALIFALHHFKPTPFYIMDEIDAALDFKNVSIVANYIKAKTSNSQFIIISLRPSMYEAGDRTVGIYKTNNCTKSVLLDTID